MSPLLQEQAPSGTLASILHQANVVDDPESQDLADFHKLLVAAFSEGEVEPLSVFQSEVCNRDDPYVRFICTCLRDDARRLISGAYGSAQTSAAYGSVQRGDGDHILAVRFTLTEAMQRGRGISQVADYLLVDEAKQFCRGQGEELSAIVAECVTGSEAYWNRTMQLDGNPMSRLYAEREDHTLQEIAYRIPPLAWNGDGTPACDAVVPEHLQVSLRGCRDAVPVERLRRVIQSWWRAWYLRPRENFDSEHAHLRHQETVKQILEDDVLAPLARHHTLVPLTRDVRGALRQRAQIRIDDFDLEAFVRDRSS